jgi:mono/diheme cytochrome c family protein
MLRPSPRSTVWTIGVTLALVAVLTLHASTQNQPSTDVTVWDGVYTDAQAARGESVSRNHCAHCHAVDLTGMEGPALVGESFMRQWSNRPLKRLFRKIQDDMPAGNPTSLGDAEKLDTLAFILQQNGMPSSAAELDAGSPVLDSERPIGKSDRPRAGALVQSTGCLTRTGDTWILARASGPAATTLESSSARPAAEPYRSGDLEIRLLNVFPNPAPHVSRLVLVRGLLVEDPSQIVINVVALERIGEAC